MLRSVLVFLLIAFAGIFVQSTVIHGSLPAAPAPDIFLVLVVVLSLYVPTVAGLLAAFALGLLADFASGQYLGPSAGGAVVAFLVVRTLATRVYAERIFAVGMLAMVASCAKSLFYLGLLLMYQNLDLLQVYVLRTILLEAFFSGLLAPIVLKLVLSTESVPGSSRASYRSAFRPVHEL